MPYRYKLWIETGYAGDNVYDEIIESDEPIAEDDLLEMAENHFWNHMSFGGHRINSEDEFIDMDAEEEEDEEEDED